VLAIVLSGAANFGAMQAGALEVILKQGVHPEMLVGTSAGALNAIYLGAEPSLAGVAGLQDVWRAAGPEQVGVARPFTILRRMIVNQDSLIDNAPLTSFLRAQLPIDLETFGALQQKTGVSTYAVAVDMRGARLRIFGDQPEDKLLDGAMASSAVPPYMPPWKVDGERYLDGGVYTKLPLMAAIARGATRIVALDVTYAMGTRSTAEGTVGISGYALSLMVEAQTTLEIEWARRTGIDLNIVQLLAPSDVTFWDYTQAERLIERGRRLATQALEDRPLELLPDWRVRMRMSLRKFPLHPMHEIDLPELPRMRPPISPQMEQDLEGRMDTD
jgi:NTE family protein